MPSPQTVAVSTGPSVLLRIALSHSALMGMIWFAMMPCVGCNNAPPPYEPCTDAPTTDCYGSDRDPSSAQVALAMAIGDKVLEEPITSIRWDWGEAVMMVGMMQLYRTTGEARYQTFLQDWMDHQITEGYRLTTSDTCAPTAIAVGLYEQTGDTRYRGVVEVAFDYLNNTALRTPEGGLNHHGGVDLLGVSIWADSLFMFGNVMTSWGELTGEAEWLDAYVAQYDIFASLLQDPDTGFFKHAEYSTFQQDDNVFWGRGNAWVVAAGYDHLRVRDRRGERDSVELASMRTSLDRMVSAAMDSQDPETGLWWTLLNRPNEGYLETSASALFAYGMARGWRHGYLGDEVLPVIQRAMNGVRAQITMDESGYPVVTGVSGPTTVGNTENYLNVPLREDIHYGIGAVLLALTETSGLPAAP